MTLRSPYAPRTDRAQHFSQTFCSAGGTPRGAVSWGLLSRAGCATSDTVHSAGLPLTLSRLSQATDAIQRDQAWAEFVAAHSDVVLHTCRSLTRDHDAAMDAYAHALEALREDGCRRLHAYVPDGRTRFASWLVVVTRRLVLDYFRRRYGRSRSANAERQDEQQTRKRLEDLIAAEVDPDQLVGSDSGPDADLRRSQLATALSRALDAIDSRDRLLLALRFEDERSIRDIAAILGLASVFHVYRHLGRVLSAIRGMLVAQGVDGPEP